MGIGTACEGGMALKKRAAMQAAPIPIFIALWKRRSATFRHAPAFHYTAQGLVVKGAPGPNRA
jgi:hypothetical protein